MTVSTATPQHAAQPETKRGVIRWAIREVMGIIMLGAILFVASDRLDWIMAWVLVGLYLAWTAATALTVIPVHPEVLLQRTGPKKGTKRWDVALLGVVGVLDIAALIVAGLGVRLGWQPVIPPALQIVSVAVIGVGYGLVLWAMRVNAFFAQTVRIQTERGHTVATGGPYRFVRHPGYIGVILVYLATPVLLGSVWALILGAGEALLIIVRTALEDKTLHAELQGYSEYAGQVRYRLIPGLW